MKTDRRWRCKVCGHITFDGKLLRGVSPFDKTDNIIGCPECFTIDSVERVCDRRTCNSIATCGTPTKRGYATTCYKHRPKG